MFHRRNWFIETLSEVVERVTQGREKTGGKMGEEAIQEVMTYGKLKVLRETVLTAVQTRYPTLEKLAQKYTRAERDPEALFQMIPAIYTANSEDAVIQLLLEKMPSRRSHYSVHIQWSERDQTYLVNVPELPGCHTDGDTYQEALGNVLDVIEFWVDVARRAGRPVPPPDILAWKPEKAEGM